MEVLDHHKGDGYGVNQVKKSGVVLERIGGMDELVHTKVIKGFNLCKSLEKFFDCYSSSGTGVYT